MGERFEIRDLKFEIKGMNRNILFIRVGNVVFQRDWKGWNRGSIVSTSGCK